MLPLDTVPSGMSLTIPATTQQQMPMGGMMEPIVVTRS